MNYKKIISFKLNQFVESFKRKCSLHVIIDLKVLATILKLTSDFLLGKPLKFVM